VNVTSGRLKVLFIGGYGRSGSTLLDRVLGTVGGFCSCGELRHIWQEGFVENRLCGCGQPFRECPFWTEVAALAFGGFDQVDIRAILAVKSRVDRWWRSPQLAVGARSVGFTRDFQRYAAVLTTLYGGIRQAAGCDLIVDSSKDVSHGYILSAVGPPIDLSVLHLVRDGRATAYSWRHRPKHNPGSGRRVKQYRPSRAALEWGLINAATSGLRVVAPRYERMRYEDLVRDPYRGVARILDLVGEPDRRVPVANDGCVDLGIDHTVAGNPIRFQYGPVRICPDEEWRRQMPPLERAVTTALTAPALAAYGYTLRSGRSPAQPLTPRPPSKPRRLRASP
jgi:hypothetical protein